MADGKSGGVGLGLVAKILIVSGLLMCVAGAFVILFVNWVVGFVLLGVGLSDLVMSVVMTRIADRQGPPAG